MRSVHNYTTPAHHHSHGVTDTCDDDLGDIQNGAERCCFTVASFILLVCCKYTHTQPQTQACRCRLWPTVNGSVTHAEQTIHGTCKGNMHPNRTWQATMLSAKLSLKHKSIKSLNVGIHIRATAQKQLLEEDDMKAPPKAPNMLP